MYEFTLQELESSPGYQELTHEEQQEYSKEYVSENGVEEALSQFDNTLNSPEYENLSEQDKTSFQENYLARYGIDRSVIEQRKEGEYSIEGIWGGIKDLGKLFYDIPVQTMGAIGDVLEGEIPSERITVADELRAKRDIRTAQRKSELSISEQKQKVFPLPEFMSESGAVTRGDILDTMSSTGFSAVSMGAGLLGGTLGLVAGPVAGVAGGLAGSGAAAYKMDRTSFTKQLFDAVEEGRGSKLNLEEKRALLALHEQDVMIHALFEAGPEALGNVAGVIPGLKSVFKGVGKKALTKIAKGIAQLYGVELVTETATQMGQQRAESRIGLTSEDERKWTDPEAWSESLKEVAPAVMVLSTAMGGGAAVASKVMSVSETEQAVSDIPLEAEPDEIVSFIEEEIAPITKQPEAQPGIETFGEQPTLDTSQVNIPVQAETRDRAQIDGLLAHINTATPEDLAKVSEMVGPFIQDNQHLATYSGEIYKAITEREQTLRQPEKVVEEVKESLVPEEIESAVNKLEQQLEESEQRGVITEGVGQQEQVVGGFPAITPDWFKHKTVKAYDKKHGTEYAKVVSQRDIKAVLKKVRSGKRLTPRQETTWDYIQKVAKDLQQTDIGLVADQEFTNLENEGFELEAAKDVNVGNLKEGDQVVVMKDGVPDKLTHKGRDESGDIVLQDGVTMHVDEFDVIEDVIAQKDSKLEPKPDIAAIAKEVMPDLRYEGKGAEGHSFTPLSGASKGGTFTVAEPTKENIAKTLKESQQEFEKGKADREAFDKIQAGVKDEETTPKPKTEVAAKPKVEVQVEEEKTEPSEKKPVEEVTEKSSIAEGQKVDTADKEVIYDKAEVDSYKNRSGSRTATITKIQRSGNYRVAVKDAGGNMVGDLKEFESKVGAVEYVYDSVGITTEKVSKPKKSVSQLPPENQANVEQELTRELGRGGLRRLLKGKVNVVSRERAKQILGKDYTEDTDAFYHNGYVYLIQGNIAKGTALNTLAHEYVHSNRLDFKKQKSFDRLLRAIEKRSKLPTSEGKAIREAMDKVPDDTKPEHRIEESLAYLISRSPKIGVARRYIALIKKFLVDNLGLSERHLKNIDLQAIALSVVKREAATVKESSQVGIGEPITSMKSVRTVAADQFTEARKVSGNKKAQAIRSTKAFLAEMVEGTDKFMGAISTRLSNINPKLGVALQKLDFAIGVENAKEVQAVKGLMDKAKKMSSSDFKDWNYARLNSVKWKIDELVKKYGMDKEYKKYRKTLDTLRDDANDVGMDVAYIDEYAPRMIKDDKGFLRAIGKDENRPVISDALKKRADAMNIMVYDMTDEMKSDIISNALFGGHVGAGKPGNTKERIIKTIPPELMPFYMDADASLMNYLHSMRKTIEQRKFFGKVPNTVANAKKGIHLTQARIRKEQQKTEPNDEKIQSMNDNIAAYQIVLDKYKYNTRDYLDNIATYVGDLINKKEISPGDERILTNILTARFHEAGARGIIQAYKNFSYIDTMGSVTSALTQIGDLAWAGYENGFFPTLKAVGKSITKKSKITKEDVGIERAAQEFADSDTLSNMVAKVFKWTGLEKIDSIGKEALLNSSLEAYEKKAKSNPKKLAKEIEHIFEGETQATISDLQNGIISENVKLLVYIKLLGFQPVALSEMPEQYLKAGNGRIFYMLKTFTLKQFDVYRREVYNGLKSGNKAKQLQSMKNLVVLSMFFVMANAGADELKDWVLGRKTSFSDRVADNILRLFGVSKFVTWKARTEGVGSAMIRQMLFPFKFIDSLSKDIVTAGDEKGLYSLSSIPHIGKLAYWHMGRGTNNRTTLWERRFSEKKKKLKKYKEKVEKNPDMRSKYRKELGQLYRVNKFQSVLNKQKKTINRLKALEKTGKDVSKAIKRLEDRRVKMIESFYNKL